MSKIVSGTLIASDAAINVECGFVPDFVRLWTDIGGTELVYEWFKVLGDASAGTGQYGILVTQGSSTGVPTTAATGIIAYDVSVAKLAFDNPSGDGPDQFADFPDAFVAGASRPTARTSSAIGTITKPSKGNENGLVAECTSDSGVFGTEPTWPTKPGDTVSDGTNTWTMRTTKIVQVGVKGFTIGVTVATNSEILVFKAEQHDRSEDMGDADTESPVQFRS